MAPLMSQCVKPMCQLARMNGIECRKHIRLAPDYLVDGIGECCHNILRGNIPLNHKQKKALRRYKHVIRKVGDPTHPTHVRRHVLVQQKGGFLPLLLRTALPFVISYLGDRFVRR